MVMKFIGWAAYLVVAVIGSLFAIMSGPWFGFAVVLAFIFGPKIWKSM